MLFLTLWEAIPSGGISTSGQVDHKIPLLHHEEERANNGVEARRQRNNLSKSLPIPDKQDIEIML